MTKKDLKTKGALWSSNIFSLLGSATAFCCAGPGLAGCGMACASTCGSVGLSLFGLSSTGLAHWIGEYWYIFLILSVLSFAEAFYRIFHINKAKAQRRPKIIFFSSLALAIFLFSKMLFSC